MTFTTAAAKEFKQRVAALCGARAADLNVATFHSFCLSLCREHRGELQKKTNFDVVAGANTNSCMEGVGFGFWRKQISSSLILNLRRKF